MAPPKRGLFAIPKGKGRRKNVNQYPVNTLGRAQNAIVRVEQNGTPQEKRMVYSAVRKHYPGLAKRSGVVPTSSGTGRRYGERKGTTHRRRRRR